MRARWATVTGTIALALLLAGCLSSTPQNPQSSDRDSILLDVGILQAEVCRESDGDRILETKVRVTNPNDRYRVSVDEYGFEAVDESRTVHEPGWSTDFPSVDIGPGESAEGRLTFANAGPPTTIRYQDSSPSAKIHGSAHIGGLEEERCR